MEQKYKELEGDQANVVSQIRTVEQALNVRISAIRDAERTLNLRTNKTDHNGVLTITATSNTKFKEIQIFSTQIFSMPKVLLLRPVMLEV